jgi:hypothetical protein
MGSMDGMGGSTADGNYLYSVDRGCSDSRNAGGPGGPGGLEGPTGHPGDLDGCCSANHDGCPDDESDVRDASNALEGDLDGGSGVDSGLVDGDALAGDALDGNSVGLSDGDAPDGGDGR